MNVSTQHWIENKLWKLPVIVKPTLSSLAAVIIMTIDVAISDNKSGVMTSITLQWRHNGHDSVSNHHSHDCLLNRLFKRRSKKTSKFRATGLFAGNSPGTGEFPAQMASDAENVSIWWRHHEFSVMLVVFSSKFLSLSINDFEIRCVDIIQFGRWDLSGHQGLKNMYRSWWIISCSAPRGRNADR